jgi:hypothetical protein
MIIVYRRTTLYLLFIFVCWLNRQRTSDYHEWLLMFFSEQWRHTVKCQLASLFEGSHEGTH